MNQQMYGLGQLQDGYGYRTQAGDGLTPEELAFWDQQMAAGDAQRNSGKLSADQGGWTPKDEYYAQKDSDRRDRGAAQEKADWLMRSMSPEDVNNPNYGEKYYKTLGNKGEASVSGMPVPKNYEPPAGITNRPNDPDMMRLEQIRQQQGYSPQSAPDQYPNVSMGGPSGVGLSAMENGGARQVAPTQVQTAQALMDTIQNGTPRQSILAAAKAAGYGSADIVQGQDGSMQLVSRGGGPIYSGGQEIDPGTQTKVLAQFRPGKDGLRDVADFLHTVLTPQQQKANEGLVKYAGEQANRSEDKSFDREKLMMSEGMKTDAYNRSLAAMYAKELDAAQKAHAADLINSDKPFDKEAFDKSFDAGLSRFGVTPKTGQVGLGQMPPQGRPGNEAVTPEYQDLYNLQQQGAGGRLRSLVGKATPQPTPMQTRGQPTPMQVPAQTALPPQAVARLKEGAVVRFGNGQSWTLQNGQPVQVQAQQAPVRQAVPTAAPQAMPAQQEAPQVGLGQPSPMYMAQSGAKGLVVPGNIDIANRPQVKNKDGSISTVRSASFNVGGKEVLIPTVSDDGRILSDDEAFDAYKKTGKHLGIFDTPEDATAYAEGLHRQQEQMYTGGPGLQAMQPQGPSAGERGAQAVSSVINPQRGNEPSPDWQEVAALPEKLEAQYPGIVGYLTAISQAQRLPFNAVLGVLTKGGEGAAKLWQGFQRARQTGSAY